MFWYVLILYLTTVCGRVLSVFFFIYYLKKGKLIRGFSNRGEWRRDRRDIEETTFHKCAVKQNEDRSCCKRYWKKKSGNWKTNMIMLGVTVHYVLYLRYVPQNHEQWVGQQVRRLVIYLRVLVQCWLFLKYWALYWTKIHPLFVVMWRDIPSVCDNVMRHTRCLW